MDGVPRDLEWQFCHSGKEELYQAPTGGQVLHWYLGAGGSWKSKERQSTQPWGFQTERVGRGLTEKDP